MAIGFNDEFDYLDDEKDSNAADAFAPKIKGSSKPPLMPKEEANTEHAIDICKNYDRCNRLATSTMQWVGDVSLRWENNARHPSPYQKTASADGQTSFLGTNAVPAGAKGAPSSATLGTILPQASPSYGASSRANNPVCSD